MIPAVHIGGIVASLSNAPIDKGNKTTNSNIT